MKIKDAVIVPRKLLGDIALTESEENRNAIMWHLLRYGLDLEPSDDKYTKYEDALNRANTDINTRPRLTDEEYERIIAHLNERAGKKFRSTTTENRRWMDRPIIAGYTVDDMLRVIDIMCDRWLGDKRMHQYLRPETLFGSKFAGYLNSGSADTGSFETSDFFGAALARSYGGEI